MKTISFQNSKTRNLIFLRQITLLKVPLWLWRAFLSIKRPLNLHCASLYGYLYILLLIFPFFHNFNTNIRDPKKETFFRYCIDAICGYIIVNYFENIPCCTRSWRMVFPWVMSDSELGDLHKHCYRLGIYRVTHKERDDCTELLLSESLDSWLPQR